MVGAQGAGHRTGGSGWKVGREKGKRVCVSRLGTPCVILHAGFQFYFGYRGAFTKRKKEPPEARAWGQSRPGWAGVAEGFPRRGERERRELRRLGKDGGTPSRSSLLTTNVTEGQCCYFRRLHRLDFFLRPLYRNMQNT